MSAAVFRSIVLVKTKQLSRDPQLFVVDGRAGRICTGCIDLSAEEVVSPDSPARSYEQPPARSTF